MQICYYTSSEHLISTLENKHLKVSRFSECNDIFELGNFCIPYHSKLSERQQARKPLRRWADRMDKAYGLICFSKDHYSPLMWAHYADRNRGACLVFDYHSQTSAGKLIQVNYKEIRDEISPEETDSLPENDILKLDYAELQRCFATKQSRWSYENEYRLIVDLKDMKLKGENYFLAWGNTLTLNQIYVGATPTICASTLQNIVGKSMKVRQKRAGFGGYQIVEQKNKALWKRADCSSDKASF